MKKLYATLGLLAFLSIPTQAFAWTYNGLSSLNPFTNFGRNGDPDCCSQKIDNCCETPKTTCCPNSQRYIHKGQPCGCAAPVKVYTYEQPMPECSSCKRANH